MSYNCKVGFKQLKYAHTNRGKLTLQQIADNIGCSKTTLVKHLRKERESKGVFLKKKKNASGNTKKRDIHSRMTRYAVSKGYKNAAEAVQKLGYKVFVKEFKSHDKTKIPQNDHK